MEKKKCVLKHLTGSVYINIFLKVVSFAVTYLQVQSDGEEN